MMTEKSRRHYYFSPSIKPMSILLKHPKGQVSISRDLLLKNLPNFNEDHMNSEDERTLTAFKLFIEEKKTPFEELSWKSYEDVFRCWIFADGLQFDSMRLQYTALLKAIVTGDDKPTVEELVTYEKEARHHHPHLAEIVKGIAAQLNELSDEVLASNCDLTLSQMEDTLRGKGNKYVKEMISWISRDRTNRCAHMNTLMKSAYITDDLIEKCLAALCMYRHCFHRAEDQQYRMDKILLIDRTLKPDEGIREKRFLTHVKPRILNLPLNEFIHEFLMGDSTILLPFQTRLILLSDWVAKTKQFPPFLGLCMFRHLPLDFVLEIYTRLSTLLEIPLAPYIVHCQHMFDKYWDVLSMTETPSFPITAFILYYFQDVYGSYHEFGFDVSHEMHVVQINFDRFHIVFFMHEHRESIMAIIKTVRHRLRLPPLPEAVGF